MNKDYILKLYSRDSLNTMSKSKKKLYKLFLTALATNLLTGGINRSDSMEIIGELERLLEEKLNAESYEDRYIQYSNYLKELLKIDKMFKLTDEDSYNNLIAFTREILEDLIRKKIYVCIREDIEKYINIADYCKIDSNVRWIGINFDTGLYPFIPDKLVWYDFKIIWNMFAKYKNQALHEWSNSVQQNMQYEDISNKDYLEVQYISGTMERTVLVSCITFVESFLYNARIIIRDTPAFRKSIENNNLITIINNDKVNDMQIIEDILFKIYPNLKENISEEYQIYKELLKVRDKYVHISVHENGDKKPEMSSLLLSSGLNIESKVKYALDIVYKINNSILYSHNINLLWWKKDESCSFEDLELFNIV